MIKLWTANVNLDIEVVVAGESVEDAKFSLDIGDVLGDCDRDVSVYWSEITSIDKMPHGWLATEPYGDYTGTCEAMMAEILEEQERKKNLAERDKLQLKLDLDMK